MDRTLSLLAASLGPEFSGNNLPIVGHTSTPAGYVNNHLDRLGRTKRDVKYLNIQRVTVARGRLGAAIRWYPDEVPQRIRDLEVSKLAAHINRVVTSSNPPTPQQATELASMLVPLYFAQPTMTARAA